MVHRNIPTARNGNEKGNPPRAIVPSSQEIGWMGRHDRYGGYPNVNVHSPESIAQMVQEGLDLTFVVKGARDLV